MGASFTTSLRIAPTHPALPGHFPDRPLVPGVVVLERVAAAWRAWQGARVARLDAKFVQPLLPEQDATIELDGDARRVKFNVVRSDGTALARGTLEAA